MTGISCTGKCYNPNMGSCECTDGSYINLFGVETKSHMPFITVANVFFQLVHKTLDIMCGSVPNEGCDWYDEFENYGKGGYVFTNKTFNETSCKEPTCDLGLPTCKDRKDKAACGNTDTMDPDLEPMVPHLTQKQAAILPVPGQAGFLPCATKEMKNKEVFKSRAKENDQYIKDLLKAVNEGAKAHEIHDSWVYSSTKGQKRKSADRKSKVRLNRRLLSMEDALGTRDLDLGKSQQQLGEGFFKKSLPRRRRSKKGCDMMTAKCVESSLRRRSRFPTYHAARAKANIKCNFCLSSADKDNVKKAADPKALASTILNKMIQKVIVPPIKAQILKRAPQLWLPVVKKLLDTITKHSLLDDKSRTAMFLKSSQL